jgi:fructose-bisphosphate aldolase class I
VPDRLDAADHAGGVRRGHEGAPPSKHDPTHVSQFEKIRSAPGFIAALDQSGGSTPGALRQYGIPPDAYANDDEMFALVHQMRTRIITSPSFNGDRVIGAILFEQTLDLEIENRPSAQYLWSVKNVVPFVKVDKGLAEEHDGVQPMKPIPELDVTLAEAIEKGVFGTKMRSVIKVASDSGVKSIVDQQFELADRIWATGLVPIIEPEVDIRSPQKADAEALLKDAIVARLDQLGPSDLVMLKLTLPDHDDLYLDLVDHPWVLRVLALSGGYSRDEANGRLVHNHGVTASFSRALTEGLSADQSDDAFDAALDDSITSIFEASIT